jgi:hypothetical protein
MSITLVSGRLAGIVSVGLYATPLCCLISGRRPAFRTQRSPSLVLRSHRPWKLDAIYFAQTDLFTVDSIASGVPGVSARDSTSSTTRFLLPHPTKGVLARLTRTSYHCKRHPISPCRAFHARLPGRGQLHHQRPSKRRGSSSLGLLHCTGKN